MRNSSAVMVDLDQLERVVRKVVRQELSRLVAKGKRKSGIEVGSAIYQDLTYSAARSNDG